MKNNTSVHVHSPFESEKNLKNFFSYLFRKNDNIDAATGFGTCFGCNKHIAIQGYRNNGIFHIAIGWSSFILAAGITKGVSDYFSFILPVEIIVSVAIAVLIHILIFNIYKAAIFSFGSWSLIENDIKYEVLKEYKAKSAKDNMYFAMYGFLAGFFTIY